MGLGHWDCDSGIEVLKDSDFGDWKIKGLGDWIWEMEIGKLKDLEIERLRD